MKIITKLTITFLLFVVCLTTFTFKGMPKVETLAIEGSVEELRGVWFTTVSNSDIAAQSNATPAGIKAWQDKFISHLETVKKYGINAIFFHVRPCNDAFYQSDYNVWSDYLFSGGDPGWDPLTWMIEECHARGIEFHAWLNPYRASKRVELSLSSPTASIEAEKRKLRESLLAKNPDVQTPAVETNDQKLYENIVLGAENMLIYNPAKEENIDYLVDTIDEIIQNYAVDGIHFDDYFYPSGGIESSIENIDYNAYITSGGTLSIADWRRENVNKLIKKVSDLVKIYNDEHDNYVAFGVSPAAVYAPDTTSCPDGSPRAVAGGMNVLCGSYSSYADLFADTKKWVVEGWLDYIVPQNYFNYNADYREVADWWGKVINAGGHKVKLYMGTAIYRFDPSGSEAGWQDSTVVNKQMDYLETSQYTKNTVDGYVLFRLGFFYSSAQYTKQAIDNYLYPRWQSGALTPRYKTYEVNNASLPTASTRQYINSNTVELTINQTQDIHGYALYSFSATEQINFVTRKPMGVYTHVNNASTIYTTFSRVEGRRYFLRAFDLNNQPLDDYYEIDLTQSQVNQAPTVELVEWDATVKTYALTDKIYLKVLVGDDVTEVANLVVCVAFGYSDTSYLQEQAMTNLGGGYFEYTFTPFMEVVGTAHFKITVFDGDITTELLTHSFNITKDGSDPNGGDAEPNDPPKQSFNCNNGAVMTTFILLGFLAVALRRKGE